MDAGSFIAIGCWLLVAGWLVRHLVAEVVDAITDRKPGEFHSDELLASARLYPARARAVMGVQQKAPGRGRAVPGAMTTEELLDEHHAV